MLKINVLMFHHLLIIMNKLICLLSILFLVPSFAYANDESRTLPLSDSLIHEYRSIIKGITQTSFMFNNLDMLDSSDKKAFGIPTNATDYSKDSANYYLNYQKFFQLDLRFVDWLLSFKNDTSHSLGWYIIANPLSSFMSQCNAYHSNRISAINLIYNFLLGSGFTCYECNDKDKDCTAKQYTLVETFLEANKGNPLEVIRKNWKVLLNKE